MLLTAVMVPSLSFCFDTFHFAKRHFIFLSFLQSKIIAHQKFSHWHFTLWRDWGVTTVFSRRICKHLLIYTRKNWPDAHWMNFTWAVVRDYFHTFRPLHTGNVWEHHHESFHKQMLKYAEKRRQSQFGQFFCAFARQTPNVINPKSLSLDGVESINSWMNLSRPAACWHHHWCEWFWFEWF